METQTALVGSYGVVELNAVASVYMRLTVVVNPRNLEENLSVGLCQSFEYSVALIFLLVLINNGSY